MGSRRVGSSRSAPARSWACPGVRWNPVGLPSASHDAWIFVVNPPFEHPMHSVSRSPFLHQLRAGGHEPWWNQSSHLRYRYLRRVVQKSSAKRPVGSSGCGAYGSPGSLRIAPADHAMRSRRGTDITPLQQTAGYLWPSHRHGPHGQAEHP